jgi:hypothetical protein
MLGAIAAGHVVGMHINTDPTGLALAGQYMTDPAALGALSEDEKKCLERAKQDEADGSGYLKLQSTRPQTLAYSLTDSPVGQLAWIVEKFKEWTDESKELPEEAVDRDQLLTNISVYWFNRNGASSANALYETAHAAIDWGAQSEGGSEPGAQSEWTPPATPSGYAMFGGDDTTRSLLRRLLEHPGKINHWSEFDRGGHFPAMEVPDLLVDDMRKFFRDLRAKK